MIWKNILQTKEGVLVSSSPLPKQRKKKKPIPEPTKKDCRKYILLLDKLTKALIVSVNRLSKEYEGTRVTWPESYSYNFTPKDNMHRLADMDVYEQINGKEMSVGIFDCIWVSGDNISEKNACILLRHMGDVEWFDRQYGDIPTKEYSTTREWGMDISDEPVSNFQIRSEEHTSELQSRLHLVCRLLLEKKKTQQTKKKNNNNNNINNIR